MKTRTYFEKLNHILPTFCTVTLGLLIGLGLIRWLLTIQFSIVEIDEEIWEFWFPILLPWIPITLWLRQKFRFIIFKGDTLKGRLYLQGITWIVSFFMLMFSQEYLTTSTGKLKELSTIHDIKKIERVRYYKIKHFTVATYFGCSYSDIRQSGKYNQYLDINIYFVAPIIVDSFDRLQLIPTYWYGVKFAKQINNKIADENKKTEYDKFYKDCLNKMTHYNFDSLDYFECIPISNERDNYLKAIESRINSDAAKDCMILRPIHGNFEKRNANNLVRTFISFFIGLCIVSFLLIWTRISAVEKYRLSSNNKPRQDDLVNILDYLIPKGNHFATAIVLDLNILVFLLMIFSGVDIISASGSEVLQWGANRRLETAGGEWWRLLTSMFLHGGLMHLFLNISGLLIAAIFIEPLLGRKNYFILYILSGLCGGIASICWYPNTISVGASGAIFGLYGAILGLLLTNAFPKRGKRGILTMIGIYVGVNLLWGLTGGIDNAAHIGGLLSGALVGIILYKLDEGHKNGI